MCFCFFLVVCVCVLFSCFLICFFAFSICYFLVALQKWLTKNYGPVNICSKFTIVSAIAIETIVGHSSSHGLMDNWSWNEPRQFELYGRILAGIIIWIERIGKWKIACGNGKKPEGHIVLLFPLLDLGVARNPGMDRSALQ